MKANQAHNNYFDHLANENNAFRANGASEEQLPPIVLPKKFTLSNALRYVLIAWKPDMPKTKIKKAIKESGIEDGKYGFAVNYYKPGSSSFSGNISQTSRSAAFYTRESVDAIFEN